MLIGMKLSIAHKSQNYRIEETQISLW